MQRSETVVSKPERLTKHQLHAKLMVGWSRLIARFGKGGFADMMELTTAGVDKQLAGSMPRFEQIDRAFDEDDTILDPWLESKGKRIVDKTAVCDVDDFKVLLARTTLKITEATHPDGPGGTTITHGEYLDGEDLMRQLNRATAQWLERCASIRAPRAAA